MGVSRAGRSARPARPRSRRDRERAPRARDINAAHADLGRCGLSRTRHCGVGRSHGPARCRFRLKAAAPRPSGAPWASCCAIHAERPPSFRPRPAWRCCFCGGSSASGRAAPPPRRRSPRPAGPERRAALECVPGLPSEGPSLGGEAADSGDRSGSLSEPRGGTEADLVRFESVTGICGLDAQVADQLGQLQLVLDAAGGGL